ncbi:unannotated protein [freshwater metagenome]|uniref:Unannotated protein n=1 Tax=freshwater metagenome TaxID=449393 RepID=A0A6J7DXK9_9ZZZZ
MRLRCAEDRAALLQQFITDRVQCVVGERVLREQDRALPQDAPVGRREAQCAQHAGRTRNEDRVDPQLIGDRRGVQRPRTAERQQREVARIEPALDRHHAQRADHLRVRDAQDARRAGVEREPEVACKPSDRLACGGAVDPNAARQRPVASQMPEHDMCVADGRFGPATPVGRGAWVGAGRLRSYAQRSALVAPRDRATARTDGMDVDHRQGYRPPRDAAATGLARSAAFDHADVAGGSAHVEAEQLRPP